MLQELSDYFVQSGFDLQELFRTLAATREYQLSSEIPAAGEPEEELFARMSIKSLHAEQIYDCLLEAMRQRDSGNVNQQFGRAFDQSRALFLSRLRYVVVDELHVLRGVFGSHTAHVLRRLVRLCHHYGGSPTFAFCSATIGEP